MKVTFKIETGFIKMGFTVLFIALVGFCSYKLFTAPELSTISTQKQAIYEAKFQLYFTSIVLGIVSLILINFNFNSK